MPCKWKRFTQCVSIFDAVGLGSKREILLTDTSGRVGTVKWRHIKSLGHHCYLVRTLWSLETYLKNNPWFVGCFLAAGTALLAPPVVAVCQVISLFKYEKIDPILSVVHKNWLPGWYILKLTGSLATNHKKIRFHMWGTNLMCHQWSEKPELMLPDHHWEEIYSLWSVCPFNLCANTSG